MFFLVFQFSLPFHSQLSLYFKLWSLINTYISPHGTHVMSLFPGPPRFHYSKAVTNSLKRTSSKQTISTIIYTAPSSIEYTTRVAKILARRTGKPIYVGCSIDPNGLGLTVEEEMEGLSKIVNVITEKFASQQEK